MPSLTRADSCASEREGWILFVGWFVGKKGKGVVSTSISEDGLVRMAGGRDGRLYVFGNSSEPPTVIQAGFPGLSTSISLDGMRILAGGGPRVGYYQIVVSKPILTVVTSSATEGADPLAYLLVPGLSIAALGLGFTLWLAKKRLRNSADQRTGS